MFSCRNTKMYVKSMHLIYKNSFALKKMDFFLSNAKTHGYLAKSQKYLTIAKRPGTAYFISFGPNIVFVF